MDVLARDLLRRVLGDFFDVHAALGARDDRVAARRAVLENGEVEFLRDVHGLADEDLADEFSLGAGLVRDERLPEHLACEITRLTC